MIELHFAHANGYPPQAYRLLFDRLSERYSIQAMRMRPLWPGADPTAFRDWRPLADDLQDFLDQQSSVRHDSSGLVGAGHSMGATTTLRLALRQPERFRALVLIDPVLFPPRMIYQWKIIYRLGLAYRIHPLVKSALRRRNSFESRDAMFDNYRPKPVFARMSDEALQAYVDSLACDCPDGGIRLCYPPAWEARIYVTGLLADLELWDGLSHLAPPLLIIRGAHTDTFWESTARLVQQRLPTAQVHTVPDATHLVPLEKPDQVARIMIDFLSGNNALSLL